MAMKYKIQEFALDQAMGYISGNPRENLPKLLKWLDIVGGKESFSSQKEIFRKVLADPDNNWNQYIMGLWRDIDNVVLPRRMYIVLELEKNC